MPLETSKEAQAGAFYLDPSDPVKLNTASPEEIKTALMPKLDQVAGFDEDEVNNGAPGHPIISHDVKILKAFRSCTFNSETTMQCLSKAKLLPKRSSRLLALLKAASAISAVVDSAAELVNEFSRCLWAHE
eukprot:1635271-Amphidinium_carterae.2